MFAEKIKKLSELLKSLGVVVTIFISTVSSVYVIVNKAIDDKIIKHVNGLYDNLDKRITPIEEYVYEQIVLAIEKQYHKIKKDPMDIKIVDIEGVIKNWRRLPNSYKTDVLTAQYKVIYEWYLQNRK